MRDDTALVHYQQAVAFMDAKDWASATHAFRRAIEVDPSLATAYIGLGAALGIQGLWTLSIEAHSHALALVPDDVDTRYNLGVGLAELGRSREAIHHFRQVLAARDDHETAIRLGVELIEQDEFAEALVVFEGVTSAPRDGFLAAVAWANTAIALAELDRPADARTALTTAESLYPNLFEDRPELSKLSAQLESL